MMKYLQILLIITLFYSCIPLKVAPKIENYKITKAKKFKRNLPNQNAFVFKDPKDANEFYQYIEAKLGFENQTSENYNPFKINNKAYYLAFYEVERTTKTLNLVPIATDLAVKSQDPLLENFYTSRKGDWYIVITITSADSLDCLASNYKNKEKVISYLKTLKEDYLATNNYEETFMKR